MFTHNTPTLLLVGPERIGALGEMLCKFVGLDLHLYETLPYDGVDLELVSTTRERESESRSIRVWVRRAHS